MSGKLASAAVLAVALVTSACKQRTPAPPRIPRVVSLHDVTTEIVVALGATDRLVGVAGPVDQPADVVAAIRAVPEVGDLESIVAQTPNVVLGTAVVEARSPELVRRLRERGVDVFLVDPRGLEDVFAMVVGVAARVGRAEAGAKLATRLRARAAVVVPAARPLRVFVYDCCDPAFTAGKRAVLTDLLARAGAVNVFADVDVAWGKVPWELVVARRPELILINDYAMDGQDDVAGKRAQLARLPTLAKVPVGVLPLGEVLGGIRSVDGLTKLAALVAQIHREAG